MIEGVTSSAANAQVAKTVSQPAVSAALSKNAGHQTEPPKAPYISPFVKVDTEANKAVILIRDSDTGDVLTQFPSESAIKARQIADAERERIQANKQKQQNDQNTDDRSVQFDQAIETNAVISAEANKAISALNAASSVSNGVSETGPSVNSTFVTV